MSGTVGSVGGAGSSSQPDIEFKILCDHTALGANTQFLRRYTYAAGVVTTTDTAIDGITPYTVQGTIVDCQGLFDVLSDCFTTIFDDVGYSVGDSLLRLTLLDRTQIPPAVVSTTYFNRNTGAALAVAPPSLWLRPCDLEVVSQTNCYTVLIANPPYTQVGETLYVTRVSDVSNPIAPTLISIIYYNATQGTSFTQNEYLPLPGLDIEQCQAGSDSEFLVLCDDNAGIITRFLRRYTVNPDGTVSVTNTTVDGLTAYTPAGTVQFCQPCGRIEVLCDDNSSFLRHLGCDGTVTDTALDGSTAYTPTGTVKVCEIKNAQPLTLCDDNGPFLRHLVYAADGLSTTIFDTALDGTTAYTATGTVKVCSFDVEYQLLCDHDAGTVVPFLRRYTKDESGAISVADTSLDGVTAYVAVGNIGTCAPVNVDPVVLCDDNGSFLRHVVYSGDGESILIVDTELDGTDYTPVGTIKNCGASGKVLIEACDQTTVTTGNLPGVCGTNQQVIDAVDIQDAEEKDVASGQEVNVNDNDLEMAGLAEAGESDHMIAVRFAANIPQGAQICAAYIQFTSRSTTSFGDMTATISGEDADNSAPFVEANGHLTARIKTTANVAWPIPLWLTGNQSGADQRTPDLSAILQEIVDRPGWVAGNATAFFFVPGTTGYRRAQSITSGTAVAPKLHVEYVVDTTGATETICVPFYKEVDLSTGLATGNNYRLNAGLWEAYTPAGTVSDGKCLCPGTPGDGGTEFEILCLQDGNNVRFARVIAIDGTTGQYKKVGDYSLDFAGAYTPVGTVAPCSDSQSSVDTEVIILCDNNGSFLRHISYDGNGNAQSAFDTTLDGITRYTPVGTVKKCGGDVVTVRTYRIAGTAAGASTASTAPGDNPAVGNTVTIAAGSRSISWQWLRSTQQDPGDGSVAALTVNGFIYYAGAGSIYQTAGQSISTSGDQTIANAYQFTVTGNAFVEVIEVR